MTYQTSDYSQNKSRTTAADIADTASDLADKANQQLGKVVETAETTVRTIADRGSEAGERVQEVAGNLKGAVDKSVKDQPMATLVVAAAMGFLLGALWKS